MAPAQSEGGERETHLVSDVCSAAHDDEEDDQRGEISKSTHVGRLVGLCMCISRGRSDAFNSTG